MAEFIEKLREKARSMGFNSVGITSAEKLEQEQARLAEWLERGFHGEMHWMARYGERRADPKLVLENAKSVIVTTTNYFTPYEHSKSPSAGKISRYAWGDDYHKVIRKRLENLLGWVRKELGDEIRGRVAVDSAPAMEKPLAVRAGLGWIGKNTNLITREAGSWVFIGLILLDKELETTRPFDSDFCGSCMACIEACPTGALVEPYVLDSRRCISYATIELRTEEMPDNIAENLQGWIYGCDICQEVCPWNRFETDCESKEFAPRHDETELELKKVIEMTEDEYQKRFNSSSMKRAKLSGLKRNAKTLLKNKSQSRGK
jgi:epoxyqueuosine reductase